MLTIIHPRRSLVRFLLGCLLLTLSLACGRGAPSEKLFPSPDGRLALAVSINQSQADPTTYLCLYIEVRDAETGGVLYREQTSASNRSTWSVEWYGSSLVWLNSSDVGLLCWEHVDSGWGQCAP